MFCFTVPFLLNLQRSSYFCCLLASTWPLPSHVRLPLPPLCLPRGGKLRLPARAMERDGKVDVASADAAQRLRGKVMAGLSCKAYGARRAGAGIRGFFVWGGCVGWILGATTLQVAS